MLHVLLFTTNKLIFWRRVQIIGPGQSLPLDKLRYQKQMLGWIFDGVLFQASLESSKRLFQDSLLKESKYMKSNIFVIAVNLTLKLSGPFWKIIFVFLNDARVKLIDRTKGKFITDVTQRGEGSFCDTST